MHQRMPRVDAVVAKGPDHSTTQLIINDVIGLQTKGGAVIKCYKGGWNRDSTDTLPD